MINTPISKHISQFQICLALAAFCTASEPVKNGNKKANATAATATAADETRGKRGISFGPNGYANRPTITKRISTGYQNYPAQDFYAPNNRLVGAASAYDPLFQGGNDDYVRDFDSHGTNFISDQHFRGGGGYQHHPQYLEAPEPIIEIIIKESNETLPTPEALAGPVTSQKKKKEEVQVFYVKYKKDEKDGVVIEDPVAALSPPAYHQENADSEESSISDESNGYDVSADAYNEPTEPTAQRPSTTLRTIIHPDSERFHSNSGIQVTFNTEDKRSANQHQFQEHIEASAVQPVVADPHQQAHRPQFQPLHPQQQQQQYQQQYQFSQRENRFESRKPVPPQPPQFHGPPAPFHQELPRAQYASQPFRDVNLHRFFPENQQLPQAPPAQQQQPLQQQAPSHAPQYQPNNRQPFIPGPPQPPPPAQQPKHRAPQPIPIPLYNVQQQQLPKLSRPQQFYHQTQFNSNSNTNNNANQQPEYNTRPPPPSTLAQYRVRSKVPPQQAQPQQPQQQQQSQLQQQAARPQYSQPDQITQQQPPHPQLQSFNQPQQQPAAHFERPVLPDSHIQGGGLQLQNAPNLATRQPVGHDFANKVITGAELVASVPKYEQHITQSVPFGQPIRAFDRPAVVHPSPVANYHDELQQPQQQQQRPQLQLQPQQQPQYQQQQQQQHYQPQQLPQQQIPQNHQQPQEPQQYQHHRFLHQQLEAQFGPKQEPFKPSTPVRVENGQSDRFAQQNYYQTHVQPGHSVSTLASDVLPGLVSGHKKQKQQEQQQQQLLAYSETNARHRPTYASESVPSAEEPRNRQPNAKTSTSSTSTTTTTTSTTTTTTVAPPTPSTTRRPSKAHFDLPDEVPDDLRAQLLSSGILDNADISVLDYDKVGDVPLESLPPEHLANFYGGGGAAQISSSNKVVTVVKPNGDTVHTKKQSYSKSSHDDADKSSPMYIVNAVSASPTLLTRTTTTQLPDGDDDEPEQLLPHRQNVDLKVVRFDSSSQKSVTDKYIRPDATVLPTVEVSSQDHQYNRYLPLKVDGAQFPVPDVPELRGRRIASVVVLAPVDNVQSIQAESSEGRFERDLVDSKQIRFVAGDSLKQLLKKPTSENFKRWLDREAHTELDLQSVVLLVTQYGFCSDVIVFMFNVFYSCLCATATTPLRPSRRRSSCTTSARITPTD